MYTLEDVYKTFPSGCTEDYKILRAFEMGKQATEKRIADLEKENAELKAENEANENGAKKYAEFYFETNDQLTKAKEIIKAFLDSSDLNIKHKAEEFLGEF